MTQTAEPDITTDFELFELTDWDETVPCAYTDCDEKATHVLICGVCQVGRELMCTAHTEQTRQAGQWEQVTFDGTCGHHPFLSLCGIEPLDL